MSRVGEDELEQISRVCVGGILLFLFKIFFIYLRERESVSKRESRSTERETGGESREERGEEG